MIHLLIWLLRACLVVGFLNGNSTLAETAGDDPSESILSQAESLRIKSPEQVTILLDTLESQYTTLTQQQQQRVILLKAHQLAIKGQFSQAKNQIEKVLSQSLHPNQRVRALYLMAQISEIQTNYEDAFLYLNQAIQLPSAEQSIEAQHDIVFLAAELFARAGDYHEANAYARQALKLAEKHQIGHLECASWQNIGLIHRLAEETKLAERAIGKQIEVCGANGDVLVVADGELRLGILIQQNNQFKKSLTWLESALSKFNKVGYATGIIRTRIGMANSHFEMGDIDEASLQLELAIKPAQTQGQWEDLKQAYFLQASIAEVRGQYKLAMELFKQHLHAAGEITNTNKSLRLAYLHNQFEVERSKQQLSLNETRDRYHQLLQKSDYQQLWLVAMIFCLLLSIGFSVMFYIGRMQRREKHYRDQSLLDPLTGVFNRKHCYAEALDMYQQSCEEHSSFIVVKADIDNFKQVNIRHGYDIGDIALQAMAGRLQQATREGDILGRVGGDEFIMFFAEIPLYQVLNIVQRCQALLQELVIDNKEVSMSVSFGIAEAPGILDVDITDASDTDTGLLPFEKLIERASIALGRASTESDSGFLVYKKQIETPLVAAQSQLIDNPSTMAKDPMES